MTTRPTVICLMLSSIDGRLHPSRYTRSPQGSAKEWSASYEAVHDTLSGDAWLVGRTTMAEMSKGQPHPPQNAGDVRRPVAIASYERGQHAVVIDRSGKLHFPKSDVGGNHVVVILGSSVPDSHLAELAGDGISYIVAPGPDVDLGWALEQLRSQLGIERLLLEGGGEINGAFFAAGLVDELYVLIAPALDAGVDVQGIIAHGGEGLAGKAQLSLKNAEVMEHGVVKLHYAVSGE